MAHDPIGEGWQVDDPHIRETRIDRGAGQEGPITTQNDGANPGLLGPQNQTKTPKHNV
jgi:hypothetical protein